MFMIIYAKASIAMERVWYTHKWWHRVFTTIYCIDSYLAYKFEMEAIHNSPDDLKTYMYMHWETCLPAYS